MCSAGNKYCRVISWIVWKRDSGNGRVCAEKARNRLRGCRSFAERLQITGNTFHVTGTTTITSVSVTGIPDGTTLTIIFDGVLTFTDGSNLKLAGDFVTTADDTITLVKAVLELLREIEVSELRFPLPFSRFKTVIQTQENDGLKL